MPKFMVAECWAGPGADAFPASGIRGRLRRFPAEEVARYGIAREDGPSPFGIEDAYYLRNGGVEGRWGGGQGGSRCGGFPARPQPAYGIVPGRTRPGTRAELCGSGARRQQRAVTVDVVRGVRADDFARGDALMLLSPEGRAEWLERSQRDTPASRDRQRLAEIERAPPPRKRC